MQNNQKFKHTQFAHCESGAMSALLTYNGLKISEPMIFGLTSTLGFVYLPILKINNLPLIAYRALPKNIIKNSKKTLGINLIQKKYNNFIQANDELTKLVIKDKKIVGLQTSIFYLPYIPSDMRFHFNAHNLLVYGKQDNNYLISDPVMDTLTFCSEKDLIKARFAKGIFAPNGSIYYLEEIPKNINYEPLIKKAIKKTSTSMLAFFPYAGFRGMLTLAKKIYSLKKNTNERYLKNFLTHIVRMQEEIGTGGGGFRFLYAAFLQEASDFSNTTILTNSSNAIIESGDYLRDFTLECVLACKEMSGFDPKKITKPLIEAANIEKEVFTKLKKL